MPRAISRKYDSGGRRVLDVGVIGTRPRVSPGDSINRRLDVSGRKILDIAPNLIIPGTVSTLASSAHTPISQFPVISRGLPFASSQGGQFGGTNAEANAIDGNYGTTWDSVFQPSTDGAQWYALDLRSLSPSSKSNVWFYWKEKFNYYFDGSNPLGPRADSQFVHHPTDYKIQGHISSGSLPGVNDVGWTDIVSITNNRYNARTHTNIDLSTYNWIRFYCTRASGVSGATESISLEFDLRDARGSTEDSFFFFGDSITQAGFQPIRPGGVLWVNFGPYDNAIAAAGSRTAPVVIDGGIIGWHASDANSNKVAFIGANSCRYVALNFGSNDANAAGTDLAGLGGVSSAYAQQFKTDMQATISYAIGLGKKVIIPHIIWGSANSFSVSNINILNQIIDQLVSQNSNNVLAGPDLYTFFFSHQNLLQNDLLHPTFDDTVPAGMFNGRTGYENYIKLWTDWAIANLY